jgi:DNA-binding CsgD family transcriptional regulator
MAGFGLQYRALRLLGRERECAVIDRVLEHANNGVSDALVVRGEAGIGKSALLEYAIHQATPGMGVLRAGGVEAESDLAFAGLHGLLRPVLAHLGELPETQSRALAGALGLAPSAHPDRLLISAAVLGLLAAAAEGKPMLCVIDDAQWVDRPSAEALVFTARRLQAERIAILFGVRAGEIRQFEAAGVPELELTGLSQPFAAAVLAASRASSPAPAVQDRLLAEADGNPLALLELPEGLSAAQLEGRAPLPEAIPLSPRLEGVFRQRVRRLPQAAQTALLIAAADTAGDAPAVLRAAAGLGLAPDALDPAEAAGLVWIAGQTVTFRHPLVRSALYQGATHSQRQRVHAALASAFTGDDNVDRRVWHQAMATLTGDEEVAAALEASARRAELRAGHASAATAFLRAAELSTDEARRVRRITAAAGAAWHAGQPDRARAAIARALPLASGELRAHVLHLSGVVEANAGSLPEACTRLLEAAESTGDPSLRLEMLAEASETMTMTGDFARGIEIAAMMARIVPVSARDRLMHTQARGYAKIYGGEHEEGQSLLAGVLELAASVGDPRALLWAAHGASTGGNASGSLLYANRAVEAARRQGMLSLLPMTLQKQALELLASSSFDLAYAAAEEGYRLSVDLGYGSGWHLANMATAEAVWGREQDARRHGLEALKLGQRSGSIFMANRARHALGLLDLSIGRPGPAADQLLVLTDPGHPEFHWVVGLPAIPDAVEAAVRVGRPGDAEPRLVVAQRWVGQAPTPLRRALLARCEALLGQRDWDEAFGEATQDVSAVPPLQRARTELLYGEWLRRERRRTDARGHLRAALDLFHRLGAAPWAARAEAELRATGETIHKTEPGALAQQLTAQELKIASLVTDGLTNREIAAQLYLSPRTVDYHLRKVFTKLGIASRTELVRGGLPHDELG